MKRQNNGRLLAIRQSGPWKGEHKGRFWSLDGDDIEAVADRISRGDSERTLLAFLNVPKANHPKAIKAFELLRDAGVVRQKESS